MSRDPFVFALASLPDFVLETEADYSDAVDWVLDQCGWNIKMISNVEMSMIAQVYDSVS
jgi:hypothetical protein